MNQKFLIRHLGNMGDMVFFIPPVLATLKRRFPACHITFVTAWGFKDTRGRWGKRNQGGFCLNLMMTNPHIDQLVHYDDTTVSLEGNICSEEGRRFPTWNQAYYEQQKKSGVYAGVYELDFGIGYTDNPLTRMYAAVGLPDEHDTKYCLYFSTQDLAFAREAMADLPHPRIVLLEGLEGTTTRGWDPGKIPGLAQAIEQHYGVPPIWFGGNHVRERLGRPLSLRENIATLLECDLGIGVLSGPMHFAAAVGLPTICLFGDMPLQRGAPAYFLNRYINDVQKQHRTLLGPSGTTFLIQKNNEPSINLTPAEASTQGQKSWQRPGRQSTKSCVAVLTIEEVMSVVADALTPTLNV